jgi:hypothetical protein
VSHLHIAPIVEGHGECECIRILVERVWRELLGGQYVEVLKPIRSTRGRLVKPEEVRRAVTIALQKLENICSTDDMAAVLLLLDADEDCPAHLGPQLLACARNVNPKADVFCVLANVEYETWFVAAAESLGEYLDLSRDASIAENPEELRLAKAWVESRFKGTKYSETQDQPRMTSAMDLALCRRRSPSFDKLCRELAARRIPAETKGP